MHPSLGDLPQDVALLKTGAVLKSGKMETSAEESGENSLSP